LTDYRTQIDVPQSRAAPPKYEGANGAPMTSFYRSFGKRIFDVVASIAICMIAVPLIAVLALLIRIEGHNPFYSQERIGKGGKVFRMWKLRTMVPNADIKLAAHLANDTAAQLEWDEKQKLRNDPRITRTGHWLRRSSMDELPQIFNVLFGSMSLVGPRPMMVEQRESYAGDSYYKMLPGMTGPWQVSERSESAFSARVGHDDAYFQNMSLFKDVSLMARTVLVVFKGTGQ